MNLVADSAGLESLGNLLGEYARVARKSAAEVVSLKSRQLIFGNKSSKYGPKFLGLFDNMRAYSPRKGSIYNINTAALNRQRGIKVSPLSYQKADELLHGAPSGIFQQINGYDKKRVVIARVNKKGELMRARSNKLQKTATALLSKGRKSKKWAGIKSMLPEGHVVLNRQALATAIELVRREAAIGFWGVGFLPNRYKTMLKPIDGMTYKSGNPVGISSTDIHLTHQHTRRLIRNNTGEVLGNAEIYYNDSDSFFSVKTSAAAFKKDRAKRIAKAVMGNVKNDMREYFKRKAEEALKKRIAKELRK